MTKFLKSLQLPLIESPRFKKVLFQLRQQLLFIIFVFLFVVFSLSSEYFATQNSLFIIITQLTPLAIVVIGQTLVIISGGIDLSVGSVAALTSVLAAKLMLQGDGFGLHPLLAAFLALLVAIGIGWLQGWLIARQRISAFVATFGTLSLIKGLTMVYSNAAPIPIPSELAHFIWRANPFFIPSPVFLFLGIAFWASYMLKNTRFGRYAVAIGGNETVTRMSGVRVDYYKIILYMLSSFLAGLAGLLLMTRISSGVYTIGEDYGLLSVAAAVIGGTSLQGGVGNIRGPILGALIIIMIDTSLGLFNLSPLWSSAIIGGFILLAILADRIRQRSERELRAPQTARFQGDDSYFSQMQSKLARLISQETACEHIRLYMLDRQSNDLIQVSLDKNERVIIGQSKHLAQQVKKTQSPYWIGNWQNDSEFLISPIDPYQDMRSVLAVPIINNEHFVAVLELQSPYENVFDNNSAEKLIKLIEPLAESLENSWLLDSGWLVRHTRDACRHLGDEVYLSKSVLASWIFASSRLAAVPIAERGEALNRLIIKLIEMIQEKESESAHGKNRYNILHQTYILGLSTEEVVAQLHVSRRQYFYELKDATEALVHLLIKQDLKSLLMSELSA